MPHKTETTINDASSSLARRQIEIAEKLTDDILNARVAPGKIVSLASLARWLRVTPALLEPLLPGFVETGLLLSKGDDYQVMPIDLSGLPAKLDLRMSIEMSVAAAAAHNVDAVQVECMRSSLQLMKRCALIGDIDGYMRADRALEETICDASATPEESAKLIKLKGEFRRAWLAYNRLRDLAEPAGLRHALVEGIAAKNPELAKAAVVAFIDYMRRSF